MIPININSETYFFSIIHITKQSATELIYGILINARIYYLNKSLGSSDCIQLDSNPALNVDLLTKICDIITKFENDYEKYPSLEFINNEIIEVLVAIRALLLRINFASTGVDKEKLTKELKAMIKALPTA